MYITEKERVAKTRSFLLKLLPAVWTGLEPATPCVTGRYSNQLNYHTKNNPTPASPSSSPHERGLQLQRYNKNLLLQTFGTKNSTQVLIHPLCRELRRLLKHRKLHTPIGTRLQKMRVLREIVTFGVLENEDAVGRKERLFKDEIHDARRFRKVVRRIGKYNVERTVTVFEVPERVGFDDRQVRDFECGGLPLYELCMHVIDLDGRHATSPSRREFVGYRPRSGEQIEHVGGLEIDSVGQDIKEIFLGEVCRGTRPEVTRRRDDTPAMRPCNYSHVTV